MSGASAVQGSESNASATPVDAPSACATRAIGFFFLIFALVLFYVLIATWPVLEADSKAFKSFNVFGKRCLWEPDRQVLFMVMAAGALGSLTHVLTSFSDFVGNRKFAKSWTWWLVLRIPIGAALAVLFYFIIRGGLIVPTMQNRPNTSLHEATLQLNFYSIAAFAALAGMFSKQATDKFAEVFTALFALKNPPERKDPLDASSAVTVSPKQLTKGKVEILIVRGKGFHKDTKATFGGKARTFTFQSETEGTVTIAPEDVERADKHELVITNSEKEVFKVWIEVVEPAAARSPTGKPVVSSTEPSALTTGSARLLTLIGQNLQDGSTVTINDKKRNTKFQDGKIVVTLDEEDLAKPGELKVIVTNRDGQSSEARSMTVK